MSEQVTINRQEILTVDGLHYKQDHKLIGYEYDPWYEDIRSYESLMPTRVYAGGTVRYKWVPTNGSTHAGVWAECGNCGSDSIVYVTRNFKDAIKAGFLKLVAPVMR